MRAFVALVLLLVGCLMVPVATVGWWVRDTVVPTDSYVATVAPLATNKAVVAAVEDRLVAQTMQSVDRVDQLTGPLVRPRVERLVRTAVQRVVEDPAFAEAWRAANRVAHDQLVAVLSGDSSAVRVEKDSTVDLRLATLATAIRQELVDAGVPLADALPQVQATFPIGKAEDLARARQVYTLLDRWGRLLPLAALVLIAAGLLVARRRSRALAWTAVGSLLGLGVLAVGLVVGRFVYLDAIPSGISRPAASAVFDTVTASLRHDMVLVAVAALVALVAAYLLGRFTSH
jgi:hypothetical protein